MKGLVLSGGKGTRLCPLTFTRAKQMIPIANKPILIYVLEDLIEAGVTDIGVIISPETGDEIRGALGDGTALGAKLTFILQAEPLGLAHAVRTAQDYLAADDFVVYLGDNMLYGGINELVKAFARSDCDGTVLLTAIDNPQRFGVAVLDELGRIKRLVEKPRDPPSNLALVGVYLLTPAVHKVIESLEPSGRGEYEITDAINGLIDRGLVVVAEHVAGWWKDTGRPEDLLEANRLVLSQIDRQVAGEVTDCSIAGTVIVEDGARLAKTTVHGPAHIAAGAVIEEAVIGSHTSVGSGARITSSQVAYSIVMDEAEIRDVSRPIHASIIGQGVKVHGPAGAAADSQVRLVLGDASQVSL